jgi:transcriptional regulator with XRE-family HTH domain
MENMDIDMSRFRKRIARERKRRRWSQAEVARKLTAMNIDNMHHTTVAKIEAGDREIKLHEAIAIGDLYGVPLDALLGRIPRAQRDLDYLLEALSDTVFLARTELDRTAKSLRDRMEDIPSEYARYEALAELVGEVVGHLDAAGKGVDNLVEHFIEHIEQTATESAVIEKLLAEKARTDMA